MRFNAQSMETPRRWERLVAAALEILAIFIGGSLLARSLSRSLGLVELRRQLESLISSADPPFLQLSWVVGADLLLRYAILFALAYLVGRWHRNRNLRAYGISLGDRPWRFHVQVGVLLVAVGTFVPKSLIFLRSYLDLGAAHEGWEALMRHDDSLEFWVYMAVGSYGVVPVLEELFFRGYFQTRISEDFGSSLAILATALAFTVSHTQYFLPSVFALGMLGSLFLSALLLSYVRFRTGSVLPCIIAHALGNTPVAGPYLFVTLLLMLALMIRFRAVLAEWGVAFFKTLAGIPSLFELALGIAVIMFLLAVVLVLPGALPAVAVVSALIFLLLESRERKARRSEPTA